MQITSGCPSFGRDLCRRTTVRAALIKRETSSFDRVLMQGLQNWASEECYQICLCRHQRERIVFSGLSLTAVSCRVL
jgi:hypothetical protein